MEAHLKDAYALAAYIKQAEKQTPAKAYVQGRFENVDTTGLTAFGDTTFKILMGPWAQLEAWLSAHEALILTKVVEVDRRNSAIPLLDLTQLNARIEPGAIIRDQVSIGAQAIVMMGAVINIGASIGERTMIDMNAVVGARAVIGASCHIGAGAVVAGVLEPPSKQPVVIEDEVLIGANAVILEGVRVGRGAVVAAGAIVTQDVPKGVVVAGSPARVIKTKDDQTIEKTKILEDLR
jgi:2,3,4,5-tetrahydropyridine-2,6-dicarboxylate N-acetyltransferase